MTSISFTLKKFLKKAQIATLLTVTMLGMSTMALQPKAAALSIGGPYDCTANSVMWCGAKDTQAIQNNYNHGDGHNSAKTIQEIYDQFGITSSDISSINTTAVAGSVTKYGDVYVDNQLVATNALTAGRGNEAGSTPVHLKDGFTFYERKPIVSFKKDSLTAYVVMQNGQFKFAMLSACGNPIKATPKAPQKGALACTQLLTTPATLESNGDQVVAFTATAKATNANISKYVFNLGSGHGTQTVNTSATAASSAKQTYAPGTYNISVTVSGTAKNQFTTAPSTATCETKLTVSAPTCTAPNGQTYPKGSANCDTCQYDSKLSATDKACMPPTTPTPPTTTTTAAVLPNTGAGNIIGLFLGASILGALGYQFYTRRLARR